MKKSFGLRTFDSGGEDEWKVRLVAHTAHYQCAIGIA